MDEFKKLDPKKQRSILGEMMYPRILRHVEQQDAPKITGMLVDISIMTIKQIIDMLKNESYLIEKIKEA